MTRKEAMRINQQENTLLSLGFSSEEAEALRRISMTLHRWHEKECGDDHGCIERDETTGKPYWLNSHSMRRTPIADREKGAQERLGKIISSVNTKRNGQGALEAYIQTDPRGAALYIIRPGDVPKGENVDSYYSRGVCVY
jgi:hypothetical protein